MCWKKLSYWLNGGIIGTVLALVYNLIKYNNPLNLWIIGLIIDIIFLFVVGSIIGYLLGSVIKSRNKFKNKKKFKKKRKR